MYSSTSTDYQKFPEPSAPPPPAAAGIPVSNMPELQAHPIRVASHQTVPWSTGLCGCCSDMGNCCITCWCPCITFGQIAEIVDKGTTSCVMSGVIYTLVMCVLGCPCCYSCFYRKKMRQQYALQESPCGDCSVHLFCESCSLCQEYRELKNRGFDMSLGWHGNVEKQNKGVAMAPVVEAGMIR